MARDDPCPHCGEALNTSRQPSGADHWVSCPNGSVAYGEHVYFPHGTKGETPFRATDPKPMGSGSNQSWCVPCRGGGLCIDQYEFRTCSSFD